LATFRSGEISERFLETIILKRFEPLLQRIAIPGPN
jgi:hypothetical protein